VIEYRNFRNTDPPALVEVWNEAFTGRGAAVLRSTTLLEYLTFAKPYFDPPGLVTAWADGALVGYSHAGFGPDIHGVTLDPTGGLVCTLGVVPAYRRQGIGSELLRRAEAYLRERGTLAPIAGPRFWVNPFAFGLYGGSQAPGILRSDDLAGPFFTARGYQTTATTRVWQLRFDQHTAVADGRFGLCRQRYEIHGGPWRHMTWWQECVTGPVDLQEYTLCEKVGGRAVARTLAWVLDPFSTRWGEHAVGVLDIEVLPELRRQGLARFLLSQLLRFFQDQFFTLAEIQADANDLPTEGLLRGLGFTVIDEGLQYQRAVS
jgi:ribosomal protein S18 acetylase RimI-like enzyme